MKLFQTIKKQFSQMDIHTQKAQKQAATQQFLYQHRQGYRLDAPIGFKSRADSSYFFATRSR